MQTRILLVNFTEKEKQRLQSLGVEVDLGYLSDALDVAGADGNSKEALFFSPFAIYEYKVILIRLTEKPPLESSLKEKAIVIGEKEKTNFFRFWYLQKGLIILFCEKNNYSSLDIIGISEVSLSSSSGNDKTINLPLESKGHELRLLAEKIKSQIILPPSDYVNIKEYESGYNATNRWTIFPLYRNRNDENIGIYLNWGPSFREDDFPAFIILPAFKDFQSSLEEILKTLSSIFKLFLPEISNSDWILSEGYYPREVALINEKINVLLQDTEQKKKEMLLQKNIVKEKYSYLHDLLIESNDKLKNAVIRTLREVFMCKVVDSDENKKNNFREDIVIQDDSCTLLLEVKGTRSSYPSFAFVTQVLSNLLKQKDIYPGAFGGLVLNHDVTKDPLERSNAYTDPDEEKALEDIVFIDSRVLFDLSIAILDYGMSIDNAKKILFQKGRVRFTIKDYIDKLKNNEEKNE